jgi:hypothetical protein
MKPTWDIPDEMLDNSGDFDNDFYRRFKLRRAPKPVVLKDNLTRDYMFPTFYGDVTCAMVIFFCSYEKAASLISGKLGPLVKPVRMAMGRSLIAFSCYEYRQVMGVRPYNEIAMAIPVMVNAGFNPPILPMLLSGAFSHFGYYIAGMPVTSYENMLRGNRIWGLPKVTEEIEIVRRGGDCLVSAMDEKGGAYLNLNIPMAGTPTNFDVSSYLYTRLDGKLLRSETNFRATFNVKKNMLALMKKGAKPEQTYIETGSGSFGSMLKELDIEPNPFQFRYAEHMSACFDLPEEQMPSWAAGI